jgi:hypothetical protein
MAITTPLFANLAIVARICDRHMGLRVRNLLVCQFPGLVLAAINAAPEIQRLLTSPTHWGQNP